MNRVFSKRTKVLLIASLALACALLAALYNRRSIIDREFENILTQRGWSDVHVQVREVGPKGITFAHIAASRRDASGEFTAVLDDVEAAYTPAGLAQRRLQRLQLKSGTVHYSPGEQTEKHSEGSSAVGDLLKILSTLPVETIEVGELKVSVPFESGEMSAALTGRYVRDASIRVSLGGELNLQDVTLGNAQLSGVHLRTPAPWELNIRDGDLAAVHGEATIQAERFTLGKTIVALEPVHGKLELVGHHQLKIHLTSERAVVGVELRDLSADLALNLGRLGSLTLTGATFGVFGGKVSLSSFPVISSARDFNAELDGLNLEEISKLYGQERLTASGLIDGNLPVHIEMGSVSITKGSLKVRDPGGVIHYGASGEAPGAFDVGGDQLKLVLQALSDFRYTALQSEVDYLPSGELLLKVALSGQNPALMEGRKINFNVQLQENIPALLDSLSVGSDISRSFGQ